MYNIPHKKPFADKIISFGGFLLWFFLLPLLVLSQKTRVDRMHFAPLITENGLSSRLANCILRDKLGFVWIGTQDGLNRYNGRRVKIFNGQLEIPMKLSGNDVLSIEEDTTRGVLWVGSSGGIDVIDIYSCKVILSFKVGEKFGGVEMPSVTSLKLYNNGLLIGSQNGVFKFFWDQKKLIEIETAQENTNSSDYYKLVERIEKDSEGNIWVCQPNIGIVLFAADQTHPKVFYNATLFRDTSFNYQKFSFFSVLQSNKIALIYNGNFYMLDRFEDSIILKTFPDLQKRISKQLTGGIKKSNSELLIYNALGIYRYFLDTGEIHLISGNDISANNKHLQGIRCGIVDIDQNLWIASDAGVFVGRLSMVNLVENFLSDKSGEHSLDHIYSIYNKDNTLWVGTHNKLFTINRRINQWSLLDSGPYFYLIDSFRENSIIVSNVQGTHVYFKGRKKSLSSMYKELLPLEREELSSIVSVGDSLYFFGTGNANGVFVWRLQTRELLTIENYIETGNLQSKRVRSICKDNKGRIWILSDNSFSIIDLSNRILVSRKIFIPDDKEFASVLMDMRQTGNTYWIAAYGKGVLGINEDGQLLHFINSAKGLTNSGVYKLLKLSNDNLLITSNDGLFYFNTKINKIIKYSESEGMQTNEYEEGASYSSSKLHWVGGLNGLSMIDEKFFSIIDNNPKLFVDDATITLKDTVIKKSLLGESFIELAPYYQEVNFSISLLDYSNPNAWKFEYRIAPKQEEWITLGNKRDISIVGLPPGEFFLSARVISGDTIIALINPIKILVLPKWYQTTWFYLLCLLVAAAIAYGLYRYRIWQLQKEFRFKEKISADLHDDLGSTITGIKMFTELGVSTGSPEYYMPVKQGLTDAAMAIREMIWVLDDTTNSIAGIIHKIEHNYQSLLKTKSIHLKVHVDSAFDHIILKTNAKRDLYLILKEFINNSLKYSGCSEIKINANQKDKTTMIEISDNGKGFESGKTNMGNGLFNMQERGKRMGYKVRLNSSPGQGTSLRLEK